MIFRDETSRKAAQLDLTPLINVVFLLLVFFMLAGSLKPLENVDTATQDALRPIEDELLIVSVNRAGLAMIDNESLSDETLKNHLLAHSRNGGKVGIRPDARLDASRLVQLGTILQQAGFDTMTLITQNR